MQAEQTQYDLIVPNSFCNYPMGDLAWRRSPASRVRDEESRRRVGGHRLAGSPCPPDRLWVGDTAKVPNQTPRFSFNHPGPIKRAPRRVPVAYAKGIGALETLLVMSTISTIKSFNRFLGGFFSSSLISWNTLLVGFWFYSKIHKNEIEEDMLVDQWNFKFLK